MDRIIVNKLSKNFFIPAKGRGAILKNSSRFIFKNHRLAKIAALDDVSFTIKAGEKIGLIGLNGSGKTTLLRLIGGVYRPSNGVVRTEGKIVSFLMTAWPQLRLTVTDNIFLGGALYGLTIEETKEYLLPIVEFAELKEYLGAPLYQLSAGMQERLAIAAFLYIAFGNQAGILLIDELFSNSDINFLNKAIRKLEDFLQTQATILMASHNFEVMVKTCNRIIWLDHGRVVKIGASQEIIKEFIGVNAVASPTQD